MENIFSFANKNGEACHIAICGRSKSGKSTILKQILREVKNKFHRIFIFCQTDQYTHEYSDEYDDVHPFDIDKFIAICEKAKSYKENDEPKKILIVMDDISSKFYTDEKSVDTISQYMTECRHYGVSIILSVHYLHQVLNPLIRENIHHYIVNGNQTKKSVDILSEVIYYNKEEHDNKSLQQFIKNKTSFHPYCFLIISTETEKFTPIYVKK